MATATETKTNEVQTNEVQTNEVQTESIAKIYKAKLIEVAREVGLSDAESKAQVEALEKLGDDVVMHLIESTRIVTTKVDDEEVQEPRLCDGTLSVRIGHLIPNVLHAKYKKSSTSASVRMARKAFQLWAEAEVQADTGEVPITPLEKKSAFLAACDFYGVTFKVFKAPSKPMTDDRRAEIRRKATEMRQRAIERNLLVG